VMIYTKSNKILTCNDKHLRNICCGVGGCGICGGMQPYVTIKFADVEDCPCRPYVGNTVGFAAAINSKNFKVNLLEETEYSCTYNSYYTVYTANDIWSINGTDCDAWEWWWTFYCFEINITISNAIYDGQMRHRISAFAKFWGGNIWEGFYDKGSFAFSESSENPPVIALGDCIGQVTVNNLQDACNDTGNPATNPGFRNGSATLGLSDTPIIEPAFTDLEERTCGEEFSI